jgi:hypothetical protein
MRKSTKTAPPQNSDEFWRPLTMPRGEQLPVLFYCQSCRDLPQSSHWWINPCLLPGIEYFNHSLIHIPEITLYHITHPSIHHSLKLSKIEQVFTVLKPKEKFIFSHHINLIS